MKFYGTVLSLIQPLIFFLVKNGPQLVIIGPLTPHGTIAAVWSHLVLWLYPFWQSFQLIK